MTTNLPKGACLIVLNDNNQILCAKRPSLNKWGLPGGKREPGESAAENAVRECKEETGLNINATNIEPLFSGVCEADPISKKDFWVDAFIVKLPDGQTPSKIEPDIDVKWQSFDELLTQSSFPKYHTQLQQATNAYLNKSQFDMGM